jgi:hypothetical protein
VATIHVHRPAEGWTDRLRAYKLEVDGEEVARIKRGESKALEVSAGQHEIVAKVDWTSSDTLMLELGDSDVVHLGVGNNVEWKQPGGPYGTLVEMAVKLAIKRDTYLKLAPIEPPRG